MMSFFQGLQRAYGVYELTGTTKEVAAGTKITGSPKTKQGDVTYDLWAKHLTGETGLGIIPINDKSECHFGAIDIDLYKGFDVPACIKSLTDFQIPVIPMRSKSGGLHLFMFLSEPAPARLLVDKLSAIAQYIGQAKAEIFPKQVEILSDRGDIGQWINMPYYDAEKSQRYAYTPAATPMTLDEFLFAAQRARLSKSELEALTLNLKTDFEDGPPCLQKMATIGFAPGTRNDAMFAVGVYLKQAFPGTFSEKVEEYNRIYCSPQLSALEIQNIQKSLKKKDYFYTCDKAPCKDYCDKNTCMNRRYGVGTSVAHVKLSGLTKFAASPPLWFVEVDGYGRVELTTAELQNPKEFQRKCMETINRMPPVMKPDRWQKMINGLMDTVTIIDVPKDSTTTGLFIEVLEKFCSRSPALRKQELRLGKPFRNEEDGRTYFRVSDLLGYLDRMRFKDLQSNKILSILREIGGQHTIDTISGVTLYLWSIPSFPKAVDKVEIPEMQDNNAI